MYAINIGTGKKLQRPSDDFRHWLHNKIAFCFYVLVVCKVVQVKVAIRHSFCLCGNFLANCVSLFPSFDAHCSSKREQIMGNFPPTLEAAAFLSHSQSVGFHATMLHIFPNDDLRLISDSIRFYSARSNFSLIIWPKSITNIFSRKEKRKTRLFFWIHGRCSHIIVQL